MRKQHVTLRALFFLAYENAPILARGILFVARVYILGITWHSLGGRRAAPRHGRAPAGAPTPTSAYASPNLGGWLLVPGFANIRGLEKISNFRVLALGSSLGRQALRSSPFVFFSRNVLIFLGTEIPAYKYLIQFSFFLFFFSFFRNLQ